MWITAVDFSHPGVPRMMFAVARVKRAETAFPGLHGAGQSNSGISPGRCFDFSAASASRSLRAR